MAKRIGSAATRLILLFGVVPSFIMSSFSPASTVPQAEISNGLLHAVLYLPDAHAGFYRGTRFDWSGVIASLTHESHNYYGPWFTKTNPSISDFEFQGNEIVAGPCSAIMGPVEEFDTDGKALGFDEAKPGGTFIKIGVGVLRRPDASEYSPYHLYPIVDGGHRSVKKQADSVEFVQELSDPATGYGYRYTKTVRLSGSKPEMRIEHKLENTGRKRIDSSVYDHNFLVLDGEGPGPDLSMTLPFDIQAKFSDHPELASVQGKTFTYKRKLTGTETVSADLRGFGSTAADYKIHLENRTARAGMTITGDRPLSKFNLWSIRTVLAAEPYVAMSIEAGQSFEWAYTYSYYSLPAGK